VLAALYRRVRGIEGLGGGDVKLAAGLGAFLGAPGLVLAVMLASLVGSVVGIVQIARGRGTGRTALPFGSFLAPAAALVLIAGPALWKGYLGLAGLAP
jgi:leader peptidase (prepilin peptidase)/N-methyltransferase